MERHFEQIITYADTPFNAGREDYIFADTTDGAITINLAYSQDCRQRVHYIVNTGATNAVTIQSIRSADTINAASTYTLAAGDVVKLYADDSEWSAWRFVNVTGDVITQTAVDYALVTERVDSGTNTSLTCFVVRHVTDGDMVDGFGAALGGSIRDDADVNNLIGVIKFRRSGADNSGKIEMQTRNAGSYVEALYLLPDGGVQMPTLKSGATQVAAGAATGELWYTASHATLPDNVLMIGA